MKEANFAGVCIVDNGKILLVQEAHTETYGLWSLPLGHVEDNESMQEAAIRETKEETGYNVILKTNKEIKLQGKDFKSTIDFNDCLINLTIFEAKISSGDLKTGNDVFNAKWFPLKDIHKLSLRGEWVKIFIQFLMQ